MQPGRASRTAELVCIARAVANGRVAVGRYADPTALPLLPDEARRRVESVLDGTKRRGPGARIARAFLMGRANMMVARTVAIDDALREAPRPQVVILGAGLDGRAWRMPELHDSVVFEVDHPDSQRDKRARASALTRQAREVRFVAVDFERDDLDRKLAEAGHDATRPTSFVWEGVVMYLSRSDIARTLSIVARRSAPTSRLVIAYHAPALMNFFVGLAVRRLGEPFRTILTPDEMRALLRDHGFAVVRDQGLPEMGKTLGPEVARVTRRLGHARIVVAKR